MLTYPETQHKSNYTPFEYPDTKKEFIPDASEFFPSLVPDSKKALITGYSPITVTINKEWFARFLLLDHTEYLIGPFKYQSLARRAVFTAQNASRTVPLTHKENGKYFACIFTPEGNEAYLGPFKHSAQARRAAFRHRNK